jgi:hypothetical protein
MFFFVTPLLVQAMVYLVRNVGHGSFVHHIGLNLHQPFLFWFMQIDHEFMQGWGSKKGKRTPRFL